MKKWLLLCMCLILMGCQNTESKGKVIVTTNYQIENGEVGEPLWHFTETFNEDGLVVKTKQEAENGYVLSEGVWTYEGENLVLIENQNNGKLFETKRTYKDDKIMSEHRYSEGKLLGFTLYEYGEGKNKTTKEYDQNEELTSIGTEEYVSDKEVHATMAMTALDNIMEMTIYLDDKGRQSKTIQTVDGSESVTTNNYDEQGNLVQIILEGDSRVSIWSHEYEYNKHGDYIKKTSYNDGNMYSYEERAIDYN